MARLVYSAFLFLALQACCGCGGNTSAPPLQALSMNGNYGFTLGTFGSIGGELQTTSGNVTGKINLVGPAATACAVGFFDVFGPIKPGGEVSLGASAPGASLTLNGTISADSKTLSAATFSMTGISGCVASGQASGLQVQDLSGTYSGSLTLTVGASPTQITWSEPLSQTLLNTGFIRFNGGNVTVGGIPASCGFTTSTFSDTGAGFVFGLHSSSDFGGGANGFIFSADATDATAKTLNVSLTVQGGPCAGATATGTIGRP